MKELLGDCGFVIDCETGGTRSYDCPIYSIGIVPIFAVYDRMGMLSELRIRKDMAFYFEGKVHALTQNPMDADTAKWYDQMNLTSWVEGLPSRDLMTLMVQLTSWFSKITSGIGIYNTTMWANDPSFDRVLIDRVEYACKQAIPGLGGIGLPKYWGNRCVRTAKSSLPREEIKLLPKFEGTKHNALDDAYHEALIVQAYVRWVAFANGKRELKTL
jgi:hypothetical protein